MDEFKKVDVENYLKEKLETGELVQSEVYKFMRIYAIQGTIGQVVSTILNDGFEEVKENFVEEDPETHEPGWIAENIETHERWIISDSTFKKKYEVDPDNPDMYKPKGKSMLASKIDEDIEIEPPNWGGATQKLRSGAYLLQDPDNLKDIYGVAEDEFNNTYRFVTEKQKSL